MADLCSDGNITLAIFCRHLQKTRGSGQKARLCFSGAVGSVYLQPSVLDSSHQRWRRRHGCAEMDFCGSSRLQRPRGPWRHVPAVRARTDEPTVGGERWVLQANNATFILSEKNTTTGA